MSYLRTICFVLAPLALWGCQPPVASGWSGYVEGEYVYVSAPLGGTLTQLHVRSGDHATKDMVLFSLESVSEQAARLEAQARLARANAQQ